MLLTLHELSMSDLVRSGQSIDGRRMNIKNRRNLPDLPVNEFSKKRFGI